MVIALIIVISIFAYSCYLNVTFRKKEYNVKSGKVKNDYRVLFFSDLHMKAYGKKNNGLLRKIKSEKPDCILIGGDMIITYPAAYYGVRNQYQWLDDICDFLSELNKICKVYYVDGNHEINLRTALDGAYYKIYERYISEIKRTGTVVLNNRECSAREDILICGYIEPIELYAKRNRCRLDKADIKINEKETGQFKILLTHDPEQFDIFSELEVDLVLCGHVHGGMIRIGSMGLISPSYRLFPKYCYGLYEKNKTLMIVTAGLNMHTIPIRWFNPAEYVIVNIINEKHIDKKVT